MPAGPYPHLAVNLHCTWTARTLPVVTVETTTRRTCVVLSTILQLLYLGEALYYMPTDIITFSHPRIFQVWELLWSPFCIQENANFKRLKKSSGSYISEMMYPQFKLTQHSSGFQILWAMLFCLLWNTLRLSLLLLDSPFHFLFPFSMFAFSLFSINSFLILNLLSCLLPGGTVLS